MQVKRYQPQTTAPSHGGGLSVPLGLAQTQARINPNQLGASYRAAMNAAEATAETMGALAQAGAGLFDMGQKIDAWDQTAKYNQAMATARTKLTQYADGLSQRTDYQNFESDLQKQATGLREQLGQGLHGPFADRFGLEFDNDVMQTQVKARQAQRAKVADNALAAEAQARQADMNLIGRAGASSQDRDRIQRGHIERVETLHGQGLITQLKAVELIQSFDAFRSEVELKELIDANPAQGLELLKHPQGKAAELLADVPADRLDDLTAHAQRQAKAAEAARQKNAEDQAYAAIKHKIGDDLDKQLAVLSDPARIQGLGLDLRQAQFLKSVFLAEEAQRQEQTERQRKAARQEQAQQILQAQQAGDRKKALELIGQAAAFDPSERQRMSEAMQKAQWATDPAVEAEVIRKLHRGEFKSAADLLPYLGQGLSADDTNKYGARADQMAASGKTKLNGLDYYEMSVKEFDRQGSGDAWKAKKNDYAVSLDYLMQQEGLTPNDPRTFELGKKLLTQQLESGERNWWTAGATRKSKPAFEVLAAKQPWLTGKRIEPSELGWDAEIPDANADERAEAESMLAKQRETLPGLYGDTPAEKRLALKAVREGLDFLQVIQADLSPLPWAFALAKDYGQKATWNAVQLLRDTGMPVSEANVRAVLEGGQRRTK